MGRVQSATKNIFFGQIGNIAIQLLGFISRTIFISRLGDTLNGINDLYGGILSVLSMAELGIGTALNFSLYKPVAENDKEKIKSYMLLYKKAYRAIGVAITAVGITIVPFLSRLVQQPEGVSSRDLILYYLIFLFNTVSTYFVSYKYSLVNAEQKNYIQTNIVTITRIITVVSQIFILFVTNNFYAYLLIAAIIELLQKIFVSKYLNKRYPYLCDTNIRKLPKEDKLDVINKTKALFLHRVGDIARLQTDSMIISAFINVTMVGFVGNYNLVITAVSNVVNIIFNSVVSSFGNLIATETKDKQYTVFKVYRFLASWLYGFSAIGFFILLTPFIVIWQGTDKTLAFVVVSCIIIDYYFKGERIVLSNFKTAAGVFEQDKYLAIFQGIVNLIISIVFVQMIGLVGVYIGTIVSGLIANITKPFIIYNVILKKPVKEYFSQSIKYILSLGLAGGILYYLRTIIMHQINIISFMIMFINICIIYNVIFFVLFYQTEEFRYIFKIIKNKVKNI